MNQGIFPFIKGCWALCVQAMSNPNAYHMQPVVASLNPTQTYLHMYILYN